jgi:hypothetical protein
MDNALLGYFLCPEDFAEVEVYGRLSSDSGYFKFGQDICYGQCSGGLPSKHLVHGLYDASQAVRIEGKRLYLPFDLTQIVENLRSERYLPNSEQSLERITGETLSRSIYYLLRPILPIAVRKHLQRARLSGWDKILFPHWPVDSTVESLMAHTVSLLLKARQTERVPFIWFWPNGASSALIMTHDIEAAAGRDFSSQLMDIDDSYGIKSAFQVVPEMRYDARADFLEAFRKRGFEVNVHDLNHDGDLFQSKDEFLRRAERINRYAREFGARGFRSGAMYRNQDWYDAFKFSFDMSVPNVAHLEPQRGGCCTLMPYFIGKIVELPLTTTQDYSLFHILGDYSIELWKQQIDLIIQRNGLISFIAHPDYLIEKNAHQVYLDLLKHLVRTRAEKKIWMALPGEVDRWWRSRSQMKLVRADAGWRIEGPGKERARVAYANRQGDSVVYSSPDHGPK